MQAKTKAILYIIFSAFSFAAFSAASFAAFSAAAFSAARRSFSAAEITGRGRGVSAGAGFWRAWGGVFSRTFS